MDKFHAGETAQWHAKRRAVLDGSPRGYDAWL